MVLEKKKMIDNTEILWRTFVFEQCDQMLQNKVMDNKSKVKLPQNTNQRNDNNNQYLKAANDFTNSPLCS